MGGCGQTEWSRVCGSSWSPFLLLTQILLYSAFEAESDHTVLGSGSLLGCQGLAGVVQQEELDGSGCCWNLSPRASPLLGSSSDPAPSSSTTGLSLVLLVSPVPHWDHSCHYLQPGTSNLSLGSRGIPLCPEQGLFFPSSQGADPRGPSLSLLPRGGHRAAPTGQGRIFGQDSAAALCVCEKRRA